MNNLREGKYDQFLDVPKHERLVKEFYEILYIENYFCFLYIIMDVYKSQVYDPIFR